MIGVVLRYLFWVLGIIAAVWFVYYIVRYGICQGPDAIELLRIC